MECDYFVSKEPIRFVMNCHCNEYSVTGCLEFGELYSFDFGTKGIPDCKEHYHFRQEPLLVISEIDILTSRIFFTQFLVISSRAILYCTCIT